MAKYLGRHPRKSKLSKLAAVDSTYRVFNGSQWVTNPGYLSCTDQKSGSNQPLWKMLLDQNSDAGSGYSRIFRWRVLKNQPASWVWTQWKNPYREDYWTYRHTGFYPMRNVSVSAVALTDEMVYARSKAKLAFLGKVDGEVSPFTGGVFFGEIRQTIRMVRRPLSGLRSVTAKYFSKARKLRAAAKKRLPRRQWRKYYEDEDFASALSSAYLEWVYGVKPLLSDMEGLGKAVGAVVVKPQADIRVQVTIPVAQHVARSEHTLLGNSASLMPVWVYKQNLVRGSVRLTGAIDGKMLSNAPKLRRFGLELDQFVPTVWNLIPYTFLSDYVINIGQVLSAAYTATRFLKYVWRSEKITYNNQVFCVPVIGTTGSPRSVSGGLAVAELEGFDFKRDKPDLSVNIMDLHFQDFTAQHAANAAVLGLNKYRSLKDLR